MRYSKASEYHYLYNKSAWLKLRRHQLDAQPLCAYCQAIGIIKSASVVDHINPHKGNEQLFFNSDNLQSLCKTCHDSTKSIIESKGYIQGCDKNGNPFHLHLHWNR